MTNIKNIKTNSFIEIETETTECVVNTNQITQVSYYSHVRRGRIFFYRWKLY